VTPVAPEDYDEDAEADAASDSASPPGSQRLDKWLFYARVIKSRTQAAGLVTDGSVRVNRLKVEKPSLAVRPGDVLTVSIGRYVRILKVTAPGKRRGPASEARLLFEDLTPPPPPRSANLDELRNPGSGRPTKRDRRQTDKLKGD
jgi:ribosome-associated heat shock protein Hsp15